MLQSPGHSPRQIVAAGTLDSPAGTLAAASGEAAPARKRAAAVLDEDTYVAAIERIIERDYFPSVPALRDRLDLLQAQRSGDPVLLRDVQLQILERRRQRRGTAAAAGDGRSMSRTATPGGASSFRFPSVATPTPFDAAENTPSLFPPPAPSSSSGAGGDDDPLFDDSLSLDKFMLRYTSEDNESFNRIMEKVNKKRRERYGHLLAGEQEEEEETITTPEEMATKRDRITDGYGTSGQPVSTLEGWKFRARNLLMYPGKDEAPLTEEEMAERAKGLTKEINKSNTRFTTTLSDSNSKHKEADASLSILYTPIPGATPGMAPPFAAREAERAKKYDLDELRKTPPLQLQQHGGYVESGKRSENGFSFVRTPSPAPGVDESPFITWGEIEGTPLRLSEVGEEGFDGGSADGPRYSIPNLPSRDEKAHSLSRDAARKIRERTKLFRKPPLPSPARGGSMSPNIRTLSPAAQKFVRNAIAKSSSSVDESLRASYRGSSPGLGTPKAGGRSVARFGRDGTAGSRSPSVMESSG